MGQISRKPLQRTSESTSGAFSLSLTPDRDTTRAVVYFKLTDVSQTAQGTLEIQRDNTWFRADVSLLNGWLEFVGLVPDAVRFTGTLGTGDSVELLLDQMVG